MKRLMFWARQTWPYRWYRKNLRGQEVAVIVLDSPQFFARGQVLRVENLWAVAIDLHGNELILGIYEEGEY